MLSVPIGYTRTHMYIYMYIHICTWDHMKFQNTNRHIAFLNFIMFNIVQFYTCNYFITINIIILYTYIILCVYTDF